MSRAVHDALAFYERFGRRLAGAVRGPYVAATAVLGALTVGIVVGVAGGDPTAPAGAAAVAAAPAASPTPGLPVPAPPLAPAATPPSAPVDDTAEEPDVTASDETAPAVSGPAAPDPVAVDPVTPDPVQEPVADDPEPAAEDDETADGDPDAAPRDEPTDRPDLPEIDRVTIVWMADGRSERTFGAGSPMPYVASTLAAQGLVLPRYHATAHGPVANGVALLAGLRPTLAQQTDCTTPTVITPAQNAPDGQLTGDGCIVPERVPDLLSQLTGAGRTWKVYAGDLAATGADSCRAPTPGVPDPAGLMPRPGDAFASARVPALWFAGLTAGQECSGIVDLSALDRDLVEPDRLPTLSLVVPGSCDAGAAVTCPDGRPSGPAAADAFLAGLIPRLTGTAEHRAGGLVVVVWDQAPATGPDADGRRCCTGRPTFPVPPGAVGPGGGRTGAVLLSPFVAPGTVLAKPYDHVALLRSLQDLFGLDRFGDAGRDGVEGFGPRVFARGGPGTG